MSVRVGAGVRVGPAWVSASTSAGRHRRSRRGTGWAWLVIIAVLLTVVHAGWLVVLLTGVTYGVVTGIIRYRSGRR